MPKKPKQGNTYTVQAGDSWAKIAGKLYGNQRMFKELMAANPQLKYLRPGQKINLAMFKNNEDIFISNKAAEAMGMATSDQVADFYASDPNAQKYGMTNILRDNAAMMNGQQATWQAPTNFDSGGYQDEQYRAEMAAKAAAQAKAMQGAYMPNPGLYKLPDSSNFQGANPYQDERYQATRPRVEKRIPSAARPWEQNDPVNRTRPDSNPQNKEYVAPPRTYFTADPANVERMNRPRGIGASIARRFGIEPGAYGQAPAADTAGFSTPGYNTPAGVFGDQKRAAGVTGAMAAKSAWDTVSAVFGGTPSVGANAQPARSQAETAPGASGKPAAPVDPIQQVTQQAVQNIENGTATERDYVAIANVHLNSGQMTPADWQYIASVLPPDAVKSAYAKYNATYGPGGGAPPGMDINAGGIGNPAGIPAMQNNVFVGPDFNPNKLRGYTNANGTFVAANLAGSYFAPLKPNELAGYRSQKNANDLQQSGGYPGSGLSVGLYTWRL